jgi:16S rRNA (guanine527-N7)-methyltransferase
MIENYIDISSEQKEKLDLFYQLHLKAEINLTAIKEKDDFFIKHYLDSIYIFKMKNIYFNTLIDVGSGGGFPGIVLSIFYPEARITLCESIKKKSDFLENAVRVLDLKNTIVVNERVEHIKKAKFDIVTARGVASLLKLLRFTKNVSRETTVSIFYKGQKLEDEIKEAKQELKKINKRVENVRIETPFKRTYCIIGDVTNFMRK